MSIRPGFKAALFACAVFGLSACGGSEPVDPAMFDAEVQRLVDSGDMYGEIFMTLKERRPALYADFRKIAQQEFSRGYSARDANRIAGLRMREKFVNEILELSKVASDEHVKEMIGVMIATYEYLGKEDATDCARNIQGAELEKVTEFPRELRKRETQLIIDLLNAPQTAANRRAASRNEVTNWMVNLSTLEPSVERMLVLIEKEERKGAEDKELCDGMITTYKRLSYKKGADRGTLFRGLALMALQQRLLLRNTAEPQDEDENA